MVGADRSNVDIDVAVIIKVANRATKPVHFNREAGLPGDIGKGSVSIVVIERWKGLARLVPWPIHGIDQENILPAVVVVVEKANAAAHGFRKIFLSKGPAVVFEVNARLSGYIREFNRAGRARQIRACCWRRWYRLRIGWCGSRQWCHRRRFGFTGLLLLTARRRQESGQQTANDSASGQRRLTISFAKDHRATVRFAAFAWRESSPISISMAVGPTI